MTMEHRENKFRRATRIRRARSLRVAGFTLIEMLVTLAIISVVLTFSSFAFRKAAESNVLAQAKNAVLTYAKVARSYAVSNQIETMMVVNPYNGRFEIWHLNPPAGGGPFDPISSGVPPAPALGPTNMDGYAFAPVLDSGASLPTDKRGRPLAVVNPIDFNDDLRRPYIANTTANNDNLTWAAFCFDPTGELVIRTRRIATRSYTMRDGTPRPVAERNRLLDESPDLALLGVAPFALVYGGPDGDTPITSTRGFVISEAQQMREVLGINPQPSEIVTSWLNQTRPDGRYSDFASTVILNRFSGDILAGHE